MKKAGKIPLLLMALTALVSACGGVEDQPPERVVTQNTNTTPRYSVLRAMNTLAYHMSSASPGSLTLVDVDRVLGLFQYNEKSEAVLDATKRYAQNVITGISMAGTDLNGAALTVVLGIEAREYDEETQTFSGQTRIFAAPGANFEGGQKFVITNTNSPNYLMTGLAIRLYNGKITNLGVNRKPIEDLHRGNVSEQVANNMVVLPAGWAAVGVWMKFRPAGQVTQENLPYVQDFLMYTGFLTKE